VARVLLTGAVNTEKPQWRMHHAAKIGARGLMRYSPLAVARHLLSPHSARISKAIP